MSTTARRRTRAHGERSSGAEVIFSRMCRIDRGQGCHASLERIARPHPSESCGPIYSLAQTRRHVAWLRAHGQILYAGSTLNGCNVYLFPDRRYEPKKVPVYEHRPPLWSTEPAQALFTSTPPACAERFFIDGYEVNTRIRATYSDATIRAAIAKIRLTARYKDERNIRDHSALLRHFCKFVVDQKRKAEETFRAEFAKHQARAQARKSEAALGRWSAHADAEAALKAFFEQHPRRYADEPRRAAVVNGSPAYSHASAGRAEAALPERQAQAPP